MGNQQKDYRSFAESPRVGLLAPDFFLQEADGRTVGLRDSIGDGYIVLVFYRGGWCPMCNRQLSAFAKDYEKFGALDAKIFAISSEQPTRGRELLLKLNLPYTLLTDPEHKVIELYGVLAKKREMKDMPALTHHRTVDYAIPSVFIIDREGTIRYRYIGKSFTDRPSTEEILHELSKLTSVQNQPDLHTF